MTSVLRSPKRALWMHSVEEELCILSAKRTKKYCKPPLDVRPLPFRVILRLKRDSSRRNVRFKERSVARGNFRTDFDDYSELYAPVVCIELVHALISIAVAKDWMMHQVNFKGTFLHATLPSKDRVWIRLPRITGGVKSDDG